MQRVRRLEIRTRRLVDQSLAGSYHSVYRGRGMEFSGVRGYVGGDDVRTIDWNVTARTSHLHVKKFVEERELTVIVMVDASGSERFGTGRATKMQISAEISALLVFSAIRNNDRVGLLQFTDRVEQYVPPRKGREHGLRVLRELLTLQPQGTGTSISSALEYLQHVVRKRAVVFLLSDFQDEGYDRALRVAARKHDVVALTVTDPREFELPSVGLLAVRDPENGATGVIDSGSARVRRIYEEAAARGRERLLETVRRTGVGLLEVSTAEDYERPLVRFFHERARRAARAGG